MAARAPGDEFWQGKSRQVAGALFDDQIVDHDQIRSGEAQLGKHQIDTVHPKGELVPELAHIRLFEAGTIGDHKGTLAFVNILERGEPADALPPPGMQIRGRELREPANGIIRRAGEIP